MENQNTNSESVQGTNSEIGKSTIVKAKAPKKEKKSTNEINLSSVKVNLSKGQKSLITKEKILSKREIYKGTDLMNQEEKKKFRGQIRRELQRFSNSILGKDRSNVEREKSVKDFLKFYRDNWKIQDFKMENFSQVKDPMTVKDLTDLLKYIQSVLS